MSSRSDEAEAAAERIVVSASDFKVLTKSSEAASDRAAAKPTDAPAAAEPTGQKSLSDLVTHAYAASAPEQAQWRSSVAHAVDATYGDPDPDVVVKSTRSLIDTVYRSGSEDLAAAEGETEDGAEDVGEPGGGAEAGRDASGSPV